MNRMKPSFVVLIGITATVLCLLPAHVQSHCQIPCGIYNDPMRIDMISEDITTIEKAMNQINELSKDAEKNSNQLVRWIINKEDHADRLSDIVTDYFMKQRVSPTDKGNAKAYEEYIHQLTLLHQMMVSSMKCKQTTDLDHVAALRKTLAEFKTAYLGPETIQPH